jgi:hypothetical protein
VSELGIFLCRGNSCSCVRVFRIGSTSLLLLRRRVRLLELDQLFVERALSFFLWGREEVGFLRRGLEMLRRDELLLFGSSSFQPVNVEDGFFPFCVSFGNFLWSVDFVDDA